MSIPGSPAPHRVRSCRTSLRRIRQDRRGAVAVEMVLVVTFAMLPVLALVADAGRALLLQYQVNRALHAAVIYGWGVASAPPADIVAAAQDGYGAASPPLASTAIYSTYCIPPTGTRLAAVAIPGSGICVPGLVSATWLTVSASTSFTPTLPYTFGSGPWTLSTTATVRVK